MGTIMLLWSLYVALRALLARLPARQAVTHTMPARVPQTVRKALVGLPGRVVRVSRLNPLEWLSEGLSTSRHCAHVGCCWSRGFPGNALRSRSQTIDTYPAGLLCAGEKDRKPGSYQIGQFI